MTHERCSACGLVYQRDQGNTLMFMMFTDRIPLFCGIAALYLGFHRGGWLMMIIFFLGILIPLLATLRRRQGLALALDYLAGRAMSGERWQPNTAHEEEPGHGQAHQNI